MSFLFPQGRILVFCKAPIPGQVKTRLIPPLTPEQAAVLHRQLVIETLKKSSDANLAKVELWCAPTKEHDFFAWCRERFGTALHAQTGADLGERMDRALTDALTRNRFCILVGGDIASLAAADLRQALTALESGADVVLGPAEDGGYVLIGLRRPQPALFRHMHWGTDGVLAETRRRLHRAGLDWQELEPRWDVDRPEDLARLFAAAPDIPAAAGLTPLSERALPNQNTGPDRRRT